MAAGEYLRDHHPEILRDAKLKEHFHHHLFHGFDFDNTMLRIGSMNMLLHGVENPDIRYRDSLAQDHAGEEEKYTLVLANPPFAGSLDYENCAKDLQQIVKTKKTELLFLALFLRLLKPGGRAAVIVPDGVLFGSSNAHKTLRQILVEDQKLDAVISLPGGVFKPYAGVSTAILLFTKTNSGGTDHVWFYDVDADGMSLDDKRTELLPPEKLGPVPRTALTADDHAKNNLPDILARWAQARHGAERQNAAHRAMLLRAEGRPRRAGLRPLAQPLQGSRPRRSRAPPAGRNPQSPRPTGGGDSAGHEGTGGDAEVKAVHRLDEVCEVVMGQAPRGEAYNTDGKGWPLIAGAGDFGETKPEAKKFTTEASKLSRNGDIVLGIRASIGEKVLADGVYCLGRGVAALRARTSLESRFLWHWLAHSAPRLAAKAKGATFKQVNREDISELEIALPPLAEQRRIAEVLDRAEALRAKRRAALAQLDSLTQSLFLDLFGDPATNHEVVAPQKSEGAWQSEDGRNTARREAGNVWWSNPIRHSGRLGERRTREAHGDSRRRCRGRDGSRGLDIGLLHRSNDRQDGSRRRSGAHSISNSMLWSGRTAWTTITGLAFSGSSNRKSQAWGASTTLPILKKSSFEKIEIPVPPFALQREFARRVTAVVALKTAQRASLAELDALFATLQHRAFEGEL